MESVSEQPDTEPTVSTAEKQWPKWLSGGLLGAYVVMLAHGMGSAYALNYAAHLGVPGHLVQVEPLDVYKAISFNVIHLLPCSVLSLLLVFLVQRAKLFATQKPAFSLFSGLLTASTMALGGWSFLLGLFQWSSILYTCILAIAECGGLLLLLLGVSRWEWFAKRLDQHPPQSADGLTSGLLSKHGAVICGALLLFVAFLALAERTGQFQAERQGYFLTYIAADGTKEMIVYRSNDLFYTEEAVRWEEGKLDRGAIIASDSDELRKLTWEKILRPMPPPPPIAYLYPVPRPAIDQTKAGMPVKSAAGS